MSFQTKFRIHFVFILVYLFCAINYREDNAIQSWTLAWNQIIHSGIIWNINFLGKFINICNWEWTFNWWFRGRVLSCLVWYVLVYIKVMMMKIDTFLVICETTCCVWWCQMNSLNKCLNLFYFQIINDTNHQVKTFTFY